MVFSRLGQRFSVREGKRSRRDPIAALAKSQRLSPLIWIHIFHLIRTPHRKLYLLSFIIFKRDKNQNMRALPTMCTPKAVPNKTSLPAHPTCFQNLHLPLHTGPSGTFILKACDYFFKDSAYMEITAQRLPSPVSLRKADRGPEL